MASKRTKMKSRTGKKAKKAVKKVVKKAKKATRKIVKKVAPKRKAAKKVVKKATKKKVVKKAAKKKIVKKIAPKRKAAKKAAPRKAAPKKAAPKKAAPRTITTTVTNAIQRTFTNVAEQPTVKAATETARTLASDVSSGVTGMMKSVAAKASQVVDDVSAAAQRVTSSEPEPHR